MKWLARLLAGGICLMSVPALAGSPVKPENPVVLAGGHFCVGPACIGTDRDREWRYRHHRRYYDEDGYRYRDRDRDDGRRYWR
jgi:hypothetical protein